MRMAWQALRSLLAVVLLGLAGTCLQAAPPADAEVAEAEDVQNRLLGEARRNSSSLASVVAQAESRHLRSPTPLTLYLLGRAQFHGGDVARAERTMREVVAQEPAFWQAHARLGLLAAESGDLARARLHHGLAAAQRPEQDIVLRLGVDIAMRAKEPRVALAGLRTLLGRDPDSVPLRMGVAELLAGLGEWTAAYDELRLLRARMPRDVRVRLAYARAALATQRLDEAIAEGEDLARGDPQGVPYLDLLRQAYAARQDWPRVASTLERLLPFTDAARRPQVQAAIEALRRGEVPGREAPAPEADPTLALFERCLSEDLATRRQALQEFHDARLSWVPGAILARYHAQEETDPTCRAWVLRIATNLRHPDVLRILGQSLLDGSALVRRVGAESLGEMASPVGLLYLLGRLPDMPLAAGAPDEVVAEFNAGRAALVRITGHDDLPVGAPSWVEAPAMEASWARWESWLASPEGVQAKRRAIDDLVKTGEPHPEWYLILQVWDADPGVALAAYDALAAAGARATAAAGAGGANDPVAQRMWPSFPQATDAERRPEGLDALRKRLHAWWAQWLAQRRGEAAPSR
ncbi:MAG: tetratricopeptide repeat protein [Planctomycetia bacterium]